MVISRPPFGSMSEVFFKEEMELIDKLGLVWISQLGRCESKYRIHIGQSYVMSALLWLNLTMETWFAFPEV